MYLKYRWELVLINDNGIKGRAQKFVLLFYVVKSWRINRVELDRNLHTFFGLAKLCNI